MGCKYVNIYSSLFDPSLPSPTYIVHCNQFLVRALTQHPDGPSSCCSTTMSRTFFGLPWGQFFSPKIKVTQFDIGPPRCLYERCSTLKMDYYLISATGLSVSIHVNIQKCLGPLNLLVWMSYIKLLLHLVKHMYNKVYGSVALL